MVLKEILKDLPQTQESVDDLNFEIQVYKIFVKYNVCKLGAVQIRETERNQIESYIAKSEGIVLELERVRTEIAICLLNKKK